MSCVNNVILLRQVQIILYTVTLILGMICSISQGWATKTFLDNCLLYAHVRVSEDVNSSLWLDVQGTSWGSDATCNYCTYTCVAICVYAVICLWFFVMVGECLHSSSKTGRTPPDLWLIAPTFFCNVVFFLCCFAMAGMTTDGFSTWCSGIEQSLKDGEHCSVVGEHEWSNVAHGHRSFRYLFTSMVSSWLMLITLGTQSGVSAARIYVQKNTKVLNTVTHLEEQTPQDLQVDADILRYQNVEFKSDDVEVNINSIEGSLCSFDVDLGVQIFQHFDDWQESQPQTGERSNNTPEEIRLHCIQ